MVSVRLPSDALTQHLLSYLGFSNLGCGVSLYGCSSKAQLLLLTLNEGYFLTATPPDLERGVAALGHDSDFQICQVFIFHWVHLNLTALVLNASIYTMLEISSFAIAYDLKMYILKKNSSGDEYKCLKIAGSDFWFYPVHPSYPVLLALYLPHVVLLYLNYMDNL